jgi:tetratricopeptide (TPR) repeat protein
MKKIISTLAVCGSLIVMAAPVFAQAAGACTEEGKTAIYTDFTTLRTSDPAKAYDAAKKYLACGEAEDQYTAYLKKWVAAYEKESRKAKFPVILYNDKNYAEALATGKQILAEDPENMSVIIGLGYMGYLATVSSKNETFNKESLEYARRAIKLIESGKAPANWAPFKGKDDTLAYLYNAIGRLTVKEGTSETLTSLIKAAQMEGDMKKDPGIYYLIAATYESGPYAKLSADYKTRFEGKDESPESKLALANINQVVDRMIDAYARAVALAGNDAKFATAKKEWMESLVTWYKYRHDNSDTGMNELIAGVLAKPLPPEPTPLTTLPAAAPTSTPTGANTGGSMGTGTSAVRMTTGATPPSTTGAAPPATTGAAPPATTGATPSTSSTVKPKPRNNHRRRN